MSTKKPQLQVIEGGKTGAKSPKARIKTIYDRSGLLEFFGSHTMAKADNLLRLNRVVQCVVRPYSIQENEQLIYGTVLDKNGGKRYTVKVEAYRDEIDGDVYFDGYCNCTTFEDCLHAATLLLYSLSDRKMPSPPVSEQSAYEVLQKHSESMKSNNKKTDELSQWTKALNNFQKAAVPGGIEEEAIVYLLSLSQKQQLPCLNIRLKYSKKLKRGGYGKSRELSFYGSKLSAIMTPVDKEVFNKIYAAQLEPEMNKCDFQFQLQDCHDLLITLLKTGRAYWLKTSKIPLSQGALREVKTRWDKNEHGEQSFVLLDSQESIKTNLTVLPTNPVWYFDEHNQQLGELTCDIPAESLLWLANMPPVKPDVADQTQKQLKKLLPEATTLPPLQKFTAKKEPKEVQPKVILRLYGKQVNDSYYSGLPSFIQNLPFSVIDEIFDEHNDFSTLALAECQFDYDGTVVELSQSEDKVACFDNDTLYKVVRNREFERENVDKLAKLGLQAIALNPFLSVQHPELQFSFAVAELDDNEEIVAEKLSSLQSLASKEGWLLILEDSFPAHITHEIDEWYTDIADNGSGIDWFGLNVGVLVDGEQVNILPLLLEKIKTQFKDLTPAVISELPDDTPCELQMDNGHYLKIPFERIRNILLVLCELFEEKPLDEEGNLRLSRLKASLLPEIEKAVGETRLRWLGETKLKEFGEKLAGFTGIQPVNPSENFKAQLRPYQQEGLNWLQFLREYDLNGILADDMGLGKTVQTLAHLTLEKEKGRLNKPSLLIAPTSLMTNWVNEAEKFAPDLKLLVLHGSKRKEKFEKIEEADVVLSTYPLILRDKDTLLQHEYHYLILDEAHQIKNSQSKMTQIILQLKASHRLCLTGTPMENHLGELWSLFNFILPGLLGTKSQFKRLFRTPIEKKSDQSSHQQLIHRIKPFMLRRKKGDVVQDLPEKTEIIRNVELGAEQRDLYESVRLVMESKVRKIIGEKGMNRSQIVILDALLKLRQVCCSPSLVKLEQAQKISESAKLDDLMSFLPDLVEEGRRVLIFSSFTSMLSLIEAELAKKKLSYVKLTGQTRDRKTPINRFQEKKVPIFLISLKAGGVGLNLTSADTVIHYDPWWNPAAEQQATDRAHRIGQKNPVFVYKMIAEGTVEERILEMQTQKRTIVEGVLENNKQAKLQLSQGDLDNLFKPLTQQKD